MGRHQLGEELDTKAQLVKEICTIASIFSTCTHLRRPTNIDWYLILGVDERAEIDAVRRRYRQLALQLHPDKNKHAKAEVAFKLVSEAYACLSDKARRKEFDMKRRNSYCRECHRRIQVSTAQKNCVKIDRHLKSYRIPEALKEARILQNRLREECQVIKSCLRSTGASRKESPLFDLSDETLFPSYSHNRARVSERRYSEGWQFHTSNYQKFCRGEVRCESPIYQVRSEIRTSRARTPGF